VVWRTLQLGLRITLPTRVGYSVRQWALVSVEVVMPELFRTLVRGVSAY